MVGFGPERSMVLTWVTAMHHLATATKYLVDEPSKDNLADKLECLRSARLELQLADRAMDAIEMALQIAYQFPA